MSITALDIQQQGFEHSFRGYDIEQVDVFLEHVAQEVDALVTDNARLTARVADLEANPVVTEVEVPVESGVSPEELETAIARAEKAEADALAAAGDIKSANDRARSAEAQLAAAEAKIAELENRVAESGTMDTTISAAFINAQRAADNLKEEARAEGERIYRESEAKSRELVREALIEKQRILNEVDALSDSCDRFRSEYRALLDRFSAEADANFSDITPPVVTEAAVDAAMPGIGEPDAAEPEEYVDSTSGVILDNDYDLDEID